MNFFKKTYPRVVMAKKMIIVIAVIFLISLVLFIFINIHNSNQKQNTLNNANTAKKVITSSSSSTNWYENQEVRRPLQEKVATATIQKDAKANDAQPQPAVIQKQEQTGQTNQAITEEMKKILSAPISSNQINDTSAISTTPIKVTSPLASNSEPQQGQALDDQNMQGEKKKFLKVNNIAEADYLQEGLKNPVSPYEVKAGTIIPAILITGVNSDLPGQITAQVSSNVYDTIAGKYVLIPQGAKLIGIYDSQVAYGQSRILAVWKRIIYPNGQSVNLEGMPGVDMSGYAGFNDQVNNHYGKIFGSVILMSVISAGAQLSQPHNDNNNNNNSPTVNQVLAASLGTNIMNSANIMLQKNLGIQPTLVIRPGYLMNVSVTKDIVFPGAYQESTTYTN